MNIAVYGVGYVGLVAAVCFAKLGHQVIAVDLNAERIAMLNKGESPIYEENLPSILQEQLSLGRLSFTTNLKRASAVATVHIIATGTPSLLDGNPDLSQVYSVVSSIAEHVEKHGVIVVKSTVSVGSGDAIEELISQSMQRLKKTYTLDVASNPEFLREGCAISDFLNTKRIVVGGNEQAIRLLKEMYQPLIETGIPFLAMSRRSAELSKYACNAMLACKISFINQMSQLAEQLDANIDDVRQAMAFDERIGAHFLNPGIGYGGSCFPKDVRALVEIAKSAEVDYQFLQAIDSVNHIQKNWVFSKLYNHFKQNLDGLNIGFWGLSFKPGTDDLREASSLVAINALLDAGANIFAFDPVANEALNKLPGTNHRISLCNSAASVLENNLDALVIATEWPLFRAFPLATLGEKIGNAVVVDGRNCFDLEEVKASSVNFYYSVGRPMINRPINLLNHAVKQ